eukprot:5166279-Lingulodinium_polyedra.AAC.1
MDRMSSCGGIGPPGGAGSAGKPASSPLRPAAAAAGCGPSPGPPAGDRPWGSLSAKASEALGVAAPSGSQLKGNGPSHSGGVLPPPA